MMQKDREFLERLLWPDGPVCPHCKNHKEKAIYRLQSSPASKAKVRKGLCKCGACRKQFTVITGTIFEDSHLSPSILIKAIDLTRIRMLSANELSKALQISYRAASYIIIRLNSIMENGKLIWSKAFNKKELMNVISSEKKEKATQILKSGETIRFVAEQVGIHPMTVWTLKKRLLKEVGPIYCKCGKIAGHKGWCGFRIARSPAMTAYRARCYRDLGALNIYVPSRPQYERPEIPWERETEIPLLCNFRSFKSIDAPAFDLGPSSHEIIPSNIQSPDELLMLKEEIESLEGLMRRQDIRSWEQWQNKKRHGFTEFVYRK